MRKKEEITIVLILVIIFTTIAVLLLVLFLQGTITGAVVGLTSGNDSSTIWKNLLSDTFNRNDNTTLNQGWLEISTGNDYDESESNYLEVNSSDSEQHMQDDSDAKIHNNRLVFDTQSKKNRPVITRSFPAKSSGKINGSFVFNFQRTGNDKDYEFWMQLGNNASLVDPKTSDNQGVAVNLKWGGTKNDFADHNSFGYVLGNKTTKLAIVNGGNASIQALVSLENKTFNLSINGIAIENNLNFDNRVTINTVRFYTDKIKQNDFKLRELDNIFISHTEFNKPKVVLLSPAPNLSRANVYNVTKTIEITANVTDDSSVTEVKSVVTYPNGTIWTINLSLVPGTNRYNSSFIVPNLQGQYSLRFKAIDEYNNFNNTGISSFLVNSSDADHDGVADEIDTLRGDWKNVSVEGINNLNVTIAGRRANGSFSGTNEVLFYDGTQPLVNFSYNFSSRPLDFSKVRISIATGYILVNLSQQLITNKTIYLNDNNFGSLCVKDSEVSSISGISTACNAGNETDFTVCLGNSTGITINGITCYDEGIRIKVKNLKHSALKGTTASSGSPSEGSGNNGDTGSSRNNQRNVQVLGNAPASESIHQIPDTNPVSEANSITEVENRGNADQTEITPNPTLSGAVVNRFTEKSLSPYILDGVMIISIMAIVLIVVYFTRNKSKKK